MKTLKTTFFSAPDSSKTLSNYQKSSMIRSASGYLDERGFGTESYLSSKNQQNFIEDHNKTDYDASAEISPTDSKILNEKFANYSKIKKSSILEIPTPTASHLPRPMIADEIQPKIASKKQLDLSFNSQETAKIDSSIEKNYNFGEMMSSKKLDADESNKNQNFGNKNGLKFVEKLSK